MLILVIEDDPSVARFLVRGLSEEGHQVDVCTDGVEALKQATLVPYEVIILDWSLPSLDGLSVLRQWRIQGLLTPVLVLTARSGVPTTVLALDAGADGIIVPMINSYREAKDAIEYTFYPPFGNRGVGLHRAQGYGSEFDKYYNKKSKKIELIVQIEHYKAIDDLEKIINLNKISGTFIGPFDLSSSLGMPGKWNDPKVKKVISEYEKIARNSNKLMGCHVIEPESYIVSKKIKLGYNFIAFSLDTMFLNTIVKNEMNKII